MAVGVALLLAGCAGWAGTEGRVSEAEKRFFAQNELVFARVDFTDLEVARRLVVSFEAVSARYGEGYLLLELSLQDFARLRARERELGLRVSLDTGLSEQQSRRLRGFEEGALAEALRDFPCYRTLEETFAAARRIVAEHPALAAWADIGDSWRKGFASRFARSGHDLGVLELTNRAVAGPKPRLFITSALHARELATAELATRFAEHLVGAYGTDPDVTWLLDHHEVHLLLQANPDGRELAEAGILWRKNVNLLACPLSRARRGVDLNRNFGFEWGTAGSSAESCSETYRGSAPASEPETRAIQAYLRRSYPDVRGPALADAAPADAQGLYLDLHSYGELVLWPWGNRETPAPNGPALQTLGRKLAFFNGYTPTQAIGFYPTSGTTDDFAYGELGLAAYTLELGTSFFEGCTEFEDEILPRNLPALLYAAKVARAPYQLPSGPDALEPALSGTTLTATLDDSRFSRARGTEPTQPIAAAEFYIDTPPWASGAQPHPMTPGDGRFDAVREAAWAEVPTAGLAPGRHLVFVRGQDAAGNWGPVSAVFLEVR